MKSSMRLRIVVMIQPQAEVQINSADNQYPVFLSTHSLFSQIQNNISQKYIYLSDDLFKLGSQQRFGK